MKWQRMAVQRAAIGARESAWFHEKREDDQAKAAKAFADSLDAAALTLLSLEMNGNFDAHQDRPRRRANG